MQTLQNELFEELTAAVQNLGGFVDKFIGDALLALFGAPVAHEDDPERALRAALDMIARTARLGESSAAYAGSPLMLHIGINTGPVVTGGFGVGSSQILFGDRRHGEHCAAIAVAGRAGRGAGRSAHPPADPACVLLRSRWAMSRCAARPAACWCIGSIGPLEAPRAARGLEALGLSAPLIGRDAELARMLASLDQACGGSAQLVRLVGEAGIGKSRLVNEFVARVGDEDRFADVAVRQAACSPLGEQSYGAIAARSCAAPPE